MRWRNAWLISTMLTSGCLIKLAAASELGEAEQAAALAERVNHLNVLTEWHGEYRLLRDTYFQGETGVAFLAQGWFNAAAEWMKGMHRALALLRVAGDQLAEPEPQVALREQLKRNQDGWLSLNRLASQIVERGKHAADHLRNLGELPVNIVDDYQKNTIYLNERYRDLSSAIAQVTDNFSTEKTKLWEELIDPTNRAIVALIKRAQSYHPELGEHLEYLENCILAESALQPHVDAVRHVYDVFQGHLLADRIYHAKKAWKELSQVATAAESHIRSTSIEPGLRQQSLDTINKWVRGAQDTLTRSEKLFEPSAWVARNLAKSQGALAADCRNEARRPLRNCSLLGQFIGLTEETLRQMTSEQLEFVEDSLERVKNGPLS